MSIQAIDQSFSSVYKINKVLQKPDIQEKISQIEKNITEPAYNLDISQEAIDKYNSENTPVDAVDNSQKVSETESTSSPEQNIQISTEQIKQTEQTLDTQQLQQREREVIAHENAHKSAGGQLASSARYEYTTGPDGEKYISGGEVSIDISKEATPDKTIAKMRTVRQAALAPAQPSAQDRSVAAQAKQIEAQAQQELAKERNPFNQIESYTKSQQNRYIPGEIFSITG